MRSQLPPRRSAEEDAEQALADLRSTCSNPTNGPALVGCHAP